MGRKKPLPNLKPIVTPEHSRSLESALFDDERYIGRKKALDKFFQPLPGCEHIEPMGEKLIPVGNTFYAAINPRSSFIAPQIREEYDVQRIVNLGRNMRDEGQLQNICIAIIAPESLEDYLYDLNTYFGTDIQPESVHYHEGLGGYPITICGHNRQLGAASANVETSGNPDNGILLMAITFNNPSFREVIEKQAAENTGEPPVIWQRSRSIVMYKKLCERERRPVTQYDIAKRFNVDTDQIWRAERYEALPDSIKELVMAEKIPYSAAIEFDALRDLYGEDYMVDLAYRLSAQYPPARSKVLDEVRKRLAASKLTPEVLALIENDKLTLPQAEEIARLSGIIDTDEINNLGAWICLHKPGIDEIRKKVKSILENEINGNQGLFSTSLLSAEDAALYLESSRRAALLKGINDSVKRIYENLSGLGTLLDIGMVGSLTETNPFTVAANETSLGNLIGKLSDRVSIDENVSIRDLSEYFQKIRLTVTETDIIAAIDQLINDIDYILQLEAHETAATQAQRRRSLLQNIFNTTSAVAPIQDGLF